MASTLFNAMGQQDNSFMSELEQFKQQFGAGADPRQIIQQGIQQGQFTQEQVNAAYQKMQQMFPVRPA